MASFHSVVPIRSPRPHRSAALLSLGLVACGGGLTEPDPEPQTPDSLVELVALAEPSPLPDLPRFYSAAEVGSSDAFAAHVTQVAYNPDDRWLDDFSGGFAILDCNLDRHPDLLFTSSDGNNTLWIGGGDGSFTQQLDTGLAFPGELTASASVADIDRDGDPDVLLLNQHSNNRMLVNDGSCGFEDRAADFGLLDTNRSLHATWVDLDRNGWLDLYLTNWADARSEEQVGVPATPQADRLWMRDEEGAFFEVTDQLPPDNLEAFGMVTAFIDWDEDGDLDMFQTNDRGALFISNRLYRNDGVASDGALAFTDVTEEVGFVLGLDGMGLAFGDVDLDGDVDIFNSGSFEGLFLSQDGSLVESAIASGLNEWNPWLLSWGGSLFDADADGDQDLAYAESFFLDTGLENPEGSMGPIWYFENRFPTGEGFVHEAPTGDLARLALWRAAAALDLDGDGFEDLLANPVLDSPVLYRNNPPAGRRILQVRLHGTRSNSEGRGAVVRLWTEAGVQTRWPGAVEPYSIGTPTWMTFGLGEATDAGPLEIQWPSGEVQVIESLPAGFIAHVTEPSDG